MNNLFTFKNILTLIVINLTINLSFAQSARTEVEIFQEVIGLEKKVAVAEFMALDANADNFWKIYDEYEAKRKELGMNRIKVIADYAKSYPTISDEEILALFKRTKAIKESFAKLQQTYFNKMKKEIGVSKAAQFWQLESYFNAMIQAEIYSQIPFIGENLEGKSARG